MRKAIVKRRVRMIEHNLKNSEMVSLMPERVINGKNWVERLKIERAIRIGTNNEVYRIQIVL